MKKDIARKLRSRIEIQKGTPIFLTKGWLARSKAISDRVARKHNQAHEKALQRKSLPPKQ